MVVAVDLKISFMTSFFLVWLRHNSYACPFSYANSCLSSKKFYKFIVTLFIWPQLIDYIFAGNIKYIS